MKVCVISSTRADFGLLKNLLIQFQKFRVDYKFVVIGAHLSRYYGSTLTEIKHSKLKIYKKIYYKINTSNELGISKAVSECCEKITKIFKKINPEIIILLGDRYETLSCAISAHICNIPIGHIHGGELTEGLIDDAFRHSITKMSHLHFVSNQIYKKRVIQLGENPNKVFNVGGLGVESIKNTNFYSKKDIEKKLNLKLQKKNIIINFHPETLNKGLAKKQINEIINSLKNLKNTTLIFTMPGAELENKEIIRKIKLFINGRKNTYFFKSLGQQKYFSILNQVDLMIGNSSSGLLEMPSFNKPTINLGIRQKGRIKAKSVINSEIKEKNIRSSIKKAYSSYFKKSLKFNLSPYGKGDTSKKIFSILKKTNLKNLMNKKFYDIKQKI